MVYCYGTIASDISTMVFLHVANAQHTEVSYNFWNLFVNNVCNIM